MGWPPYNRTAPISCLEASVSITKGREKSGRANTGVETRAFLSLSKAVVANRDHTNESFFRSSVKGLQIES